jgi:hypothetical protein
MDYARFHQLAGDVWSHPFDDFQESDCCPVTNSPDATLLERSLFARAQNSDQSAVIDFEQFLIQVRQQEASQFHHYTSSGPPLVPAVSLRV